MTDIVTVTFNPALDVSASVERVMPFHKLRCAKEKRDPGGGGINVARVLRRWNHDVTAIYPAGGPSGELLKRLVEAEGIRSHSIVVTGDTREDFTVFEDATGDQYRFVFPGAALSEGEWSSCIDALRSGNSRPRYVVTSGSLPPGSPSNLYARVARTAKGIGARAVVDTSGPPLKEALDAGLFLVKPNLRELRELSGDALESEADWLKACRSLVDAGKVEIVALSLAEKGALVVTREHAWRASAPPIRPVSTVGAGDSFLGTMISRLASGDSVMEALRYGVAAGSAALLSPGTELSRVPDTKRLLPDIEVTEVSFYP